MKRKAIDDMTNYIDTPKLNAKPGRKWAPKMSKATTSETATKKTRGYSKSRTEHYKDILIAVLITGVIAFVAGMHFANGQNAAVKAAASATQVSVKK